MEGRSAVELVDLAEKTILTAAVKFIPLIKTPTKTRVEWLSDQIKRLQSTIRKMEKKMIAELRTIWRDQLRLKRNAVREEYNQMKKTAKTYAYKEAITCRSTDDV